MIMLLIVLLSMQSNRKCLKFKAIAFGEIVTLIKIETKIIKLLDFDAKIAYFVI